MVMQCPICAIIPATCLTQEGLPQFLIDDGWYECTVSGDYVQPVILDWVATPDSKES